MFALVVMLGSAFPANASAAVYYISPNGSDFNSGTSFSPWKTFTTAIPRLQPGDTLLLKNGTYTASNSGFPNITCGVNAKNGTDSQRLTIKAENERRAFLKGNGSADVFRISKCSYWNVQGLRIESADFNGPAFGQPLSIRHSSNITVRRLLVGRNNRYHNSHLITLQHTANSLFEENELYYYHRHAFLVFYSDKNTFRRNYINSRGYADISGGRRSGARDRGDTGISIYPGSGNTTENNIMENNDIAIDIQATSTSQNNRFFGDISINDNYGLVFKMRGDKGQARHSMPQNNSVTNFIAISPTRVGVYFRGNKNSRCDNCSVLGGGNGFIADVEPGAEGDGAYSIYVTNSLAANTTGYGFRVSKKSGSWSGTFTNNNAYNNRINFALDDLPAANNTTNNPQLGSCQILVPASSPMTTAGPARASIGANVLYRYQDGVRTSQPLWDPKTGEFPHGAMVPGVNDLPGSSAFDVHKRLNVNTNGCPLP
jgi:hypothetical protein